MIANHIRAFSLACLLLLTAAIASAQPDKTIRVFRDDDTTASTPSGGPKVEKKFDRYMFSINPLTIVTGELPVFGEYIFAKNVSVGLGIGPTFRQFVTMYNATDLFIPDLGASVPDGDFAERDLNSVPKLGFTFRPSLNIYFDDLDLPVPGKLSLEYRWRRYNYAYTSPFDILTPSVSYDLKDTYSDIMGTYSTIRELGSSGNFFYETYYGLGFRTGNYEIVRRTSNQGGTGDVYVPEDASESVITFTAGFKFIYLLEVEREVSKQPAKSKKKPVKKKKRRR